MNSLSSRLIFTLVVILLLPLILFSFWPSSAAMDEELEEVAEKNLLVAVSVSNALERYHASIVSTFEYFADALARNVQIANADEMLLDLRFRHVCVAEFDTGDVVDGLLTDRVECPTTIPGERLEFFRSISVPGQTVVSGVVAGPDDQSTLYILRHQGPLLIVGAIGTSYFTELGGQVTFGLRGHAAIVDQFGRVLSHPLPEWVDQRMDISAVSAVGLMLDGQTGVDTFYSPALQDDMIAAFTAVTPAGWGVMIPQPMSELTASANSVRAWSVRTASIAVLLAAPLAILLLISTLKSFRLLRASAAQAFDGQDTDLVKPGALAPRDVKDLVAYMGQLGAKIAESSRILLRQRSESEHELRTASKSNDAALASVSIEADKIEGWTKLLASETHGEASNRCIRAIADCCARIASSAARADSQPAGEGTIKSDLSAGISKSLETA